MGGPGGGSESAAAAGRPPSATSDATRNWKHQRGRISGLFSRDRSPSNFRFRPKRASASRPPSQLAEPAQLLFHFAQQRRREDAELPLETPVVDGAALVDHHLALSGVARDARRHGHPQAILADR